MSVLVGYVHGGSFCSEFAKSLREFYREDASRRKLVGGESEVRGLYVADNRNAVCRNFISARYPDGTQPQWLLFLDTDIQFTCEQVYALLDAADANERAIVGGLYFGYMDGQPIPVWRQIHAALPGGWGTMGTVTLNTIEPIDAVGMGFTLIHRNVLEAIPDVGDEWRWFGHDLHEGKRLGEDLTFCARAKAVGFTTWGDSRVIVKHIKPLAIGEHTFVNAVRLKELSA